LSSRCRRRQEKKKKKKEKMPAVEGLKEGKEKRKTCGSLELSPNQAFRLGGKKEKELALAAGSARKRITEKRKEKKRRRVAMSWCERGKKKKREYLRGWPNLGETREKEKKKRGRKIVSSRLRGNSC